MAALVRVHPSEQHHQSNTKPVHFKACLNELKAHDFEGKNKTRQRHSPHNQQHQRDDEQHILVALIFGRQPTNPSCRVVAFQPRELGARKEDKAK